MMALVEITDQKVLVQCAPVYHSKQHLTCYSSAEFLCVGTYVYVFKRGAGVEELIWYVSKRCLVPVLLLWRIAHIPL